MEYHNGMETYDGMTHGRTSNGDGSGVATPGGPERRIEAHPSSYGTSLSTSEQAVNGTTSSPARHSRTTRSSVAAAEEAARHATPRTSGAVPRPAGFPVGLNPGLNIDMGGEMSVHGGMDEDRTPIASELEQDDGEGEEDEGHDAEMGASAATEIPTAEATGATSGEHTRMNTSESARHQHNISNGYTHHPHEAESRLRHQQPVDQGEMSQHADEAEVFEAKERYGQAQAQAQNGAGMPERLHDGDIGPNQAGDYDMSIGGSPANGHQVNGNGHPLEHPHHYPYPYPPQPPGYGYPPYRPPQDPLASPVTPASSSYPHYPPMPHHGYPGPSGPLYPPMGYPPPQPLDPMNPNAARNMAYPYPGYGYPMHGGYPGYGPSDGMSAPPPPGVVFARSQNPGLSRPKVKLTYEDKRRIVEIARSNSSLRQEDIAQQYGVDRSTISKILISAHRWTGPPQPPVQPIIKANPAKTAGGRFPAIEQRMHEWMDAQFSAGYEIRDNVARDKAKEIARVMGFTEERFKASAKWLDKFKERRKQNGQRASVTATYESNRPNLESASAGVPVPESAPPSAAAYAMPAYPTYYGSSSGYQMPDGTQSGSGSPATGPGQFLSRSQSSATLASSDSSGLDPYAMHGQNQLQHQQMSGRTIHGNRSEPEMVSVQGSTAGEMGMSGSGPSSRNRSRSSPQQRPTLALTADEPGQMDPASGRAPKIQSNASVHRHNSVHGATSPSPRRPGGLHRTQSNSSSASHRRSHRPTSLAASAFGLTPMQSPQQHDDFSPHQSPHPGPGIHSSFSHMNMHSSITSSTSSLLSSQTTTSSGGQPLTPSHPAGLFTNNVLEPRAPDNQYYAMSNAGMEQAQYGYAYHHSGGYGSNPPSATIEQKGDMGWRHEE